MMSLLMPLLASAEMPPIFALLAVMLLAVVVVSLVFLRARQSLLVAYFICGIFIANSGVLEALGGAQSEGGIKHMAEFGVILLLFTLGLEFSLGDLKHVQRWAFWGGGLQVAVCLAVGIGLALGFGFTVPQAIVLGTALALSSTAVSVKGFQDMDLQTRTGAKFALAVAILQDLFVIAFFLIMPLLMPSAGADESLGAWLMRIGVLVGEGALFLLATWILAKKVFPWLLYTVAKSRSRELFTLTVFGMCIGVAFLGALLDMSLALGAFVAGLAVSGTIYKHRILADVQPLKDLFLTLFFVSVGLLIEMRAVLEHWPAILAMTGVIMLGKALLILGLARWLGVRWQSALLAAASLSSVGEFSVVLLQRYSAAVPWPGQMEQTLLASCALSMGMVPMLMRWGFQWGESLEKSMPTRRHVEPQGPKQEKERMKTVKDHAIVCGYGPVGQRLVAALDDADVPTLIIELNADTVRELHRTGHMVVFADVTHAETWELVRVEHARLVAFTFPQTEVTIAAQHLVREHNKEIIILARTKFRAEAKKLEALGVDRVIHDERESAKAMVHEALGEWGALAENGGKMDADDGK
jgi:CPA2 family monovalent cation:H+ antiporter-2